MGRHCELLPIVRPSTTARVAACVTCFCRHRHHAALAEAAAGPGARPGLSQREAAVALLQAAGNSAGPRTHWQSGWGTTIVCMVVGRNVATLWLAAACGGRQQQLLHTVHTVVCQPAHVTEQPQVVRPVPRRPPASCYLQCAASPTSTKCNLGCSTPSTWLASSGRR